MISSVPRRLKPVRSLKQPAPRRRHQPRKKRMTMTTQRKIYLSKQLSWRSKRHAVMLWLCLTTGYRPLKKLYWLKITAMDYEFHLSQSDAVYYSAYVSSPCWQAENVDWRQDL